MVRGGRRLFILLGIALGGLLSPSPAKASWFIVTLAGGVLDDTTIQKSQQFEFDSGNTTGLVALNQFIADGTSKASTAGGNVFFSGASIPLLFNLQDGHAYIAASGAPSEVSTSIVGNLPASTVVPEVGGVIPASAALLGLTVSPPSEDDGQRTISANIMDSALNPLGSTSITLPSDSWWILGITPKIETSPGPGPDPDPNPNPGPDPIPDPPPVVDPPSTPEPSTFAMAALGAGALGWWRRRRTAA